MKRAILGVLLTGFLVLLSGCHFQKLHEASEKGLDYVILEEHEIPETFLKELETAKKEPFQMTYEDQGMIYAAKGYGEQEMSGYSIIADEVYESKDAVWIHTNLLGPKKGEKTEERKTYPYIVIKMEQTDKYIVFK